MDARYVYYAVLAFDDYVRVKHSPVAYRPAKPSGGPSVPLPSAYRRWAEKASEDDIDAFWDAITSPDFKRAQKISGLKSSVIAELVSLASSSSRTSGKVGGANYEWLGLPLNRVLSIFRFSNRKYSRYFERYVNKRNGPPFDALSQKAREAFYYFAVELDKEKRARS